MRNALLTVKLIISFIFLTASLAYPTGLTIGPGAAMNINNATLTVSNDVLINGTLTENAGSINVGGNWTNNGMFTAGLGTVNFIDGQSPVSITGNSTFNNFSAVTTAGKELQFQAGSEQTILNNLNLQGAVSNLLKLRSTSLTGIQAMINLVTTGTQLIIDYVDVKDHKATGQWLAYGLPSQYNSVDSGNNSRWFLPSADLAIIKTASPDPVTVGQNLTYTIMVTNNGPYTATNISVIDTLPQGVTNPIVSGAGWDCMIGSGTVTCTMSSLGVVTAPDIIITVTAPSEGGDITNTANVSATEDDPSPLNNTSSTVTSVTPLANLSITKNDSPDPAIAGGNLTYKIAVMNSGPSTATNVTVTDALPAGVSNINAVGSGWNCPPPVGNIQTCTMPALPPGTAPDITITVTAPLTTGTIINTVNISGTETDIELTNNNSSTTTKIIPLPNGNADLSITKTDSIDPVLVAGDTLTYTITVINNGPSTATGVIMMDTLPAEVTFVSATPSQGGPCAGTATVSCNLGNMASGDSATVTIVVTTNPPDGMIGNTASVTGNEPDPDTANNSVLETTNVGDVSRLTGISTRARVETGIKILVGGFTIVGPSPKTVLIRARGPSMSGPPYNFAGTLTNPTMEVFSGQTLFAANDDWQSGVTQCGAPAISCGTPEEMQAISADPCQPNAGQTVPPPGCDRESGVIVTLPPGAYTVKVKGANGEIGKGIIEVYDVATAELSRLGGISSRGLVLTGTDILVGGFIIGGGNSPKKVLIRGRGPSMSGAPYNFTETLANPALEVFSGQTSFTANDDWQNGATMCNAPAISCGTSTELQTLNVDPCQPNAGQTTPPPGCDLESGIIVTLPPGAYTVKLKGVNNVTGIGIIEVYEVSP